MACPPLSTEVNEKDNVKTKAAKRRKTLIIATAVVLTAAVLFFAVFSTAVCLTFPAETAALTALDRAGTSADELDHALRAAIGLLESKDDYRSEKFYNGLTSFASIEAEGTGNAVWAYFNPDEADKLAFSVLKYLKCADTAEELAESLEGKNVDMSGISAEKLRACTASVKSVAARIKEKGYSEWSERTACVETLFGNDRFWEVLSFKKIYRTLDYFKYVTAEVTDLSLVDLVFGKGFAERTERGNGLILSALRRLSYEKYLELFTNLPDFARFLSEVIKFMFEDVDDVPTCTADFACALREWQITALGKEAAPLNVYVEAVGTLLELPCGQWSASERAEAVAAVEALIR